VTHLKPGLTVDARGIPTPSGAAWTSTAVLRVQRRLGLARWTGVRGILYTASKIQEGAGGFEVGRGGSRSGRWGSGRKAWGWLRSRASCTVVAARCSGRCGRTLTNEASARAT
jgi:hypothetical protein